MTTALPALLGGEPAFPEGLPLVRPTLEDIPALAQRLEGVLRSGMLTNGPRVRELEERVAERVGVPHVVAVSSCTAGLMLTYQALGVGTGRSVVLPSFTFAASAHAVVWTGADVVFCEVTATRGSTDVNDLAAILDASPAASAISATHVYGHPAEVEAIDALAAARGLPVVYDAAHALGSTRAGRHIGEFGTAEVFSLSPTKVTIAGEGGLVSTHDAGLADAVRLGRDYGNPGDYDCRFPGLNARMSELHATVALASLEKLDEHIAHREDLVARFATKIDEVPGVRVVTPADGDRSTYKDLTIVVEEADLGLGAAELQWALDAEGIDTRRYYAPPIHRQRAYAGRSGSERPLPVTDRLAASVLTPPLWSHLAAPEMERIARAIAVLGEHAPAVTAVIRAKASTLDGGG